MVSDFLNDVLAVRSLTTTYRVGNHVFCYMRADGRDMLFVATDDSDWHGVLTAQYQGNLTREQFRWVKDFLREVEPTVLPDLFSVECHDLSLEVRCVLRWPLYDDYRGYDDVKTQIQVFYEYWSRVEPFIMRVRDGEDISTLVYEAKQQFGELHRKRADRNL